MYNLPYLEPTINLYKPNKLLNIENIYKYKICCHIFSVVNKKKNIKMSYLQQITTFTITILDKVITYH